MLTYCPDLGQWLAGLPPFLKRCECKAEKDRFRSRFNSNMEQSERDLSQNWHKELSSKFARKNGYDLHRFWLFVHIDPP